MSQSSPRTALQRQPSRPVSSSFPAIPPVVERRSMTRPARGWRQLLCGAIAVALLTGGGVADAEPIAAKPPSVAVTADQVAGFVAEASQRFGIPASWIRAVMRAESFGDVRALSPKGAIGLMQIMPATWAGLRVRYGLGADPYNARDNIIAGAAYLRELHDRYGAPGFLAAYNAGPARYEDHLATGRPLPAETRAYVALLAPQIGGGSVDDAMVVAVVARSWTQAAPVRGECGEQPNARSTIIRAAIGTAVDRRRSGGLDRARPSIGRPVRQDVGAESTAMSEIGLHRSLAGLGVGLRVGQGVRGTRPTDGKIKAPTTVGRMWLVWLEYLGFGQQGLLALAPQSPSNSTPRAPSPPCRRARAAMTTRDDDMRIRPGRIQHGNQGAKRPKSFVGEVMRAAKKAGHTGKSFGGSGGRQGPIDLRAGPARRPVLVVALAWPAGCGHDPDRPPPGQAVPSAPLAKHIAYLKREGVTRDGSDARMFDAARTMPTPKRSPSGARRTGIISGSRCRRRMRRRWPICGASRGN